MRKRHVFLYFILILLTITLPLAAFKLGLRWLNEKSDWEKHEEMVREENEKSLRAHEEEELQKKVKFLNAIANGDVLEGMSPSQVIDALGLPDRKQFRLSDDKQLLGETWIYQEKQKIISFITWADRGGVPWGTNVSGMK